MPKAQDLYDSATCSAIMGVFLFRTGPLAQAPAAGRPLQFCVGDNRWQQCPGGLNEAAALAAAQTAEFDNDGLRTSDIPEDWGVIANMAGEVTHRAHGARVRSLEYLGKYGEVQATAPANVSDIFGAPHSGPHAYRIEGRSSPADRPRGG